MTDERLILAIGRIERALSRLETTRQPPAPAPASDPALAVRHEALRARTAEAIMRMDALLDEVAAEVPASEAPPAGAMA